jgi:trk system potassium uptake protein TrkH
VVAGTFLIEGSGAFFYMMVFIPRFGISKGIFVSIFNAVSAFCNAGIDIIGANSLMDYYNQPLVNIVTMLLIVLGGLGFVVWFDVIMTAKKVAQNGYRPSSFFKRLNEHSRLVLAITGILLLSGALLIFLFEYNNPDTIGNMPLGDKILCSLFQSVTLRTAGFVTIPQQNFTDASFVISLILMFIGGSPVGTAGGVKTVTVAVAVFNVVAYLKDREETVVFRRKVPNQLITKALAVISVSFSITVLLLILLILTNSLDIRDAAYEVFSATATVGLSRNITSSLNGAGRVIIIIAMYLGRVGPVSMAIAFKSRSTNNKISHTDGHFIVG